MTETEKFVNEVADKHGRERKFLLPILQDIVAEKRSINNAEMTAVAEVLDISAADVYGTATFYSFLDTVPRGKNVIRVCKSITCDMKDKNGIIDTLERMLQIKLGETTEDKKFSLLETNCLGWCHKGPVMLINDEVHKELTPAKIREIIGAYLR